MQDLITIQDGQATASSRQIAENFGKEHKHVLRDIDSLQKDVSNFGLMFLETTEPDSYGRSQRIYLMNRDGFTLLAMGFTGDRAMTWKIRYIQAFNEMEKQLTQTPIPKTLPDALRAYAAEIEAHQVTTAQLEATKPKVLFADSVEASKTSILIGELAKILKQNGIDIGQNRLFDWMRKNGYLINRNGSDYNMPTQKAMEIGLFTIKETTVNHSDGHITINKTPKLTGKGQVYFVNKFLKGVSAS
jgi:anti-repressor protein